MQYTIYIKCDSTLTKMFCFQMEKECWICPEKFDTTKQLKSHFASSVHSRCYCTYLNRIFYV